MSRTKHKTVDGKEFPAKSRRKPTDRKHFGYTSGTHSQFETTKNLIKRSFEETPIDDPMYEIRKRSWERIKDKTYPEKGVDFIKYGHGNGTKKENRSKNYKKEIE